MSKVIPLMFAVSLATSSAWANVNLGVFISERAISTGAAPPKLSITASNTQGQQIRDVHIGVIGPDNRIYEFPDWNTGLRPWLAGFTIPANFELDNFPVTAFENFPGGFTPGTWQAFFALTEPGTTNITDLQLTPFNVLGESTGGNRFGSVTVVQTNDLSQGSVTVSANATFLQSDTQGVLENIEGSGFVELEQCRFEQLDLGSISTPTIPQSLDAGFLEVWNHAGSRAELVRRDTQGFITYDAVLDSEFFNSQSFRFNGDGGPDVGLFDVTIPGVPALQLNSPAANFALDGNQDLAIRWQNDANGTGEVLVNLSGNQFDFTNPSASSSASIFCRFVDDGSANVPAQLVGQLADFVRSGNSGLPDFGIPGLPSLSGVSFFINRTRFTFFNTSQEPTLDNGFASVSSSVFLTGTVQ